MVSGLRSYPSQSFKEGLDFSVMPHLELATTSGISRGAFHASIVPNPHCPRFVSGIVAKEREAERTINPIRWIFQGKQIVSHSLSAATERHRPVKYHGPVFFRVNTLRGELEIWIQISLLRCC